MSTCLKPSAARPAPEGAEVELPGAINGVPEIDLSVVVRVVGGGRFLRRCLTALYQQVQGRDVEIIVAYDSEVEGAGQLRTDFPEVVFVDLGPVRTERRPGSPGTCHELYDRRTARALAQVRGRVVAILEDYQVPAPDWCAQVLEAHRLPHAVIGGCVRHGGKGLVSWACYFLDFARYQPPFTEGPARYLTDVNLSYKRTALEGVRPLWEEKYNEVTVNWALAARGETLWRRPQLAVRLDRGQQTLRSLLVQRFYWGRLFASVRVPKMSAAGRGLYALLSPVIAAVLLARSARKAWAAPGHFKWFVAAFPYLVALTASWCLGEFVGYVTGREGRG